MLVALLLTQEMMTCNCFTLVLYLIPVSISQSNSSRYVVTLGGIKIHNGYQWYDVFEYWKPRGSLFEWTAVNERLPEEFYYPLINQNDLRPMVFGIEMVFES